MSIVLVKVTLEPNIFVGFIVGIIDVKLKASVVAVLVS